MTYFQLTHAATTPLFMISESASPSSGKRWDKMLARQVLDMHRGLERERLLRKHLQWLPSNLVRLVHHEEICRSLFRPQGFLSMLYGPFQLLDCDQDLAQYSINLCLARVKAGDRGDGVLVVEDEPISKSHLSNHMPLHHRLGYSLTLAKSSGPFSAFRRSSSPNLLALLSPLQWLDQCHPKWLG